MRVSVFGKSVEDEGEEDRPEPVVRVKYSGRCCAQVRVYGVFVRYICSLLVASVLCLWIFGAVCRVYRIRGTPHPLVDLGIRCTYQAMGVRRSIPPGARKRAADCFGQLAGRER